MDSDTSTATHDLLSVEWWSTRTGNRVALATLIALLVGALFVSLGRYGVWEPWEADQLLIAQEYAARPPFDPDAVGPRDPGYNWAVPTMDAAPVQVSLLGTWLTSSVMPSHTDDIRAVIGSLELKARLPIAMALALLALAIFFWTRRFFGTLCALLSSVTFVTLPVIAVGAHALSTPLLFVVTTSLTILAGSLLIYDPRRRWLWSLAAGVALSLCFLDQRLVGALVPLYVLVSFGVTQIAYTEGAAPPARDIAIAWLITLSPLLLIALIGPNGETSTLERPHVRQLLFTSFSLTPLLAGVLLMRRTDVGRALLSPQGALAIALPTATALVLLGAYARANPTLLEDGVAISDIPALSYALGHQLFHKSAAKDHIDVAIWLRQLGFATFPWAALVPIGLGHLALASRDPQRSDLADALTPRTALRRLVLLWALVSLLVVSAFSSFGHYFYPAYPALAIGVGLFLADHDALRQMRRSPLLLYAMGFTAVAIVLMLGKDLERYPYRFLEPYVALDTSVELPDEFSFGKTYKPLKYIWTMMLMVSFFGLASWALQLPRRLVELRDAVRAWRAGALPDPDPDAPSPMAKRAAEGEAFRERGEGVARLAALLESPPTATLVWAGVFAASMLVFVHVYVPRASVHLSQRSVFETYLSASEPDEPLFRYLTPRRHSSIYLKDIETLASSRELLERFERDERFFAVLPRDRLAQVNFEVRQRTKRNVHVLHARSERLLLISNQLDEGVEDENFVAAAIFEEPPKIPFPTAWKDDSGQDIHATFDDALELLGYGLDRPGDVPSYSRGEEIELRLYFRVLKHVPSSQQIFIHIDARGNRINGDHYPMDRAFPTTYWLPGDVVVDRKKMKVGAYAQTGVYTINFGFFSGSKRMKVAPKEADAGRNRVTIGKLEVVP